MSDIVRVSLEGEPDTLTIDNGSPVITIDDGENVVAISPEPDIILTTDERPEIVVTYDFSTHIGVTALLAMLTDSLDVGQFVPELASDIQLMNDLWFRVGDDIEQVLISEDVDSIVQISSTYTDTEIETLAVDVRLVEDGVVANTSAITQTATDLTLLVTELDTSTEDSFTAQSARIDVNASGINSSVIRMDGIDGDITQNSSDIVQNALGVATEVIARETLENGTVADNTSRSVQTADSLIDVITDADYVEGRLDTAEVSLTAQGQAITVMSQSLEDDLYSLTTTQTITPGAYGVSITEDTGSGALYVTGFELVLHPLWTVGGPTYGFRYVVDDVVTYTDTKTYKCILAHTATVDNSPGSVATTTYWVEETNGAQSEFNIRADSFSVIDPSGGVPIDVFSVNGGVVTINGDLVIGGSVESDTYAAQNPAVSWYQLDHTTGTADFNNMEVSFTGGSSISVGTLQDSVGNMIIDLTNAEITINKADGLLIDSAGGLVVNSGAGIAVTAGGDISIDSVSGNNGELKFLYNTSVICDLYASYDARGDFMIESNTASQANDLKMHKWWSIEQEARQISLDAYLSGSSLRKGSISCIPDQLFLSAAGGYASTPGSAVLELHSGADVDCKAELLVIYGTAQYHRIKMTQGVEVHTGLLAKAHDNALDTLIPGSGDHYYYTELVTGFPSIRFNAAGVFYSKYSWI